ncbi:MAG: ATP-binding protein [Pseudanabaenaceae cyanobacterium]
MGEKSLELKISIPPVEGIEDIPIAAIEVLACKMGFPPDQIQDIVQALTEACVNAIMYTNNDANVEIVVYAAHDRLVVEVRDKGCGFDPSKVTVPDFDLMQQVGGGGGGFGLHMIKALVDKVEIDSSSKGTTIRMSKYLNPLTNSSLAS